MNLIDFFIVYLAVGAPFGIYYFFMNRLQTNTERLWIKSALTFIFWIPFAVFLLSRNKSVKKSLYQIVNASAIDSDERGKSINSIQKEIEKIFLESNSAISIYQLRETIERYTGLTLALEPADSNNAALDQELFKIAPTSNVELGAICLKRRNRKRLNFHQIYARQDFLYLIEQLIEADSDETRLKQQSIKLTDILGDTEAQRALLKIFAESAQTAARADVQSLEKDLWKPEIRKPQLARRISHLPAMKAALNRSRKG